MNGSDSPENNPEDTPTSAAIVTTAQSIFGSVIFNCNNDMSGI